MRYQGLNSNSLNDLRWYALHVRSRHETKTAVILENKGYETFVPTYRARRAWSDRIVELTQPLFPGYMFCRITLSDRLTPVIGTPGVTCIVGVAHQPVPVEDGEIAALQAIVNSQLTAEPWPYLREGANVRIQQGPLSGIEGIVVKVKKHQRLVVSVSLLQRSVAVEIDRMWATPIRIAERERPCNNRLACAT